MKKRIFFYKKSKFSVSSNLFLVENFSFFFPIEQYSQHIKLVSKHERYKFGLLSTLLDCKYVTLKFTKCLKEKNFEKKNEIGNGIIRGFKNPDHFEKS